jgi:hypothetical protein
VTALGFVIVCLAAARITRIITLDTIGQPIRDWAEQKHHLLDELVSCPWCIGFHISVLCVVAWWLAPDVALWLLAPFAVSHIVGLLANHDA